MKLADLAARIAQKSGITSGQAEHAVSALKDVIAEELKNTDKFYLYGLGTLQVQTRKGRRGRNPKTGQVLEIPPKRVIKWSSSKSLDKAAGMGVVKPIALRGGKPEGVVITPVTTVDAKTASFEMIPDFGSSGTGAIIEEPPVVSARKPTGVADADRMLKRARSMAKVNVDDIFLYYGDPIKEAVGNGQDPHEVVAEQLEQARKTLARRVGEEIASKEDFIENAFLAKLETL